MRYVTKGLNVKHYEEGLTNVGRYETQGQTVGRYTQEAQQDWLSNPVGVEKMPTPSGWTPEWPVQQPIGPSANYRVLPQVSGCGVCGLGAGGPIPPPAASPTPAGNLLGIALTGLALVGVFWYFTKEDVRRNPRRRRARRNLVQGVASYSNAADAEAGAARKRRDGYRVEIEKWSPSKWIVISHSK